MKNIQLWSRDIDRKILIVIGAFCSLLVAALIGSVLPPPFPFKHITIFDALLTTALLVLVWSVFRVVRPDRYSRKWAVAEAIVIPVVWGLLVGVLAVWFCGLNSVWQIDYERTQQIVTPIL